MAVTYEEILTLFQETDRKLQATKRLMREQSQETERLMRERSRETDRQIAQVNTAIGRLGNRLGDFIEDAVRPAAVRLFRERGIAVHEVHQQVFAEREGEAIEIDLWVVNDTEAVAIECKSLLSVDDVNEHQERLAKVKTLLPKSRDSRVLGAVAAMTIPDDVAKYADRQGLFVIAQRGEQLTIRNDVRFSP
jgi:hypothetical protein